MPTKCPMEAYPQKLRPGYSCYHLHNYFTWISHTTLPIPRAPNFSLPSQKPAWSGNTRLARVSVKKWRRAMMLTVFRLQGLKDENCSPMVLSRGRQWTSKDKTTDIESATSGIWSLHHIHSASRVSLIWRMFFVVAGAGLSTEYEGYLRSPIAVVYDHEVAIMRETRDGNAPLLSRNKSARSILIVPVWKWRIVVLFLHYVCWLRPPVPSSSKAAYLARM